MLNSLSLSMSFIALKIETIDYLQTWIWVSFLKTVIYKNWLFLLPSRPFSNSASMLLCCAINPLCIVKNLSKPAFWKQAICRHTRIQPIVKSIILPIQRYKLLWWQICASICSVKRILRKFISSDQIWTANFIENKLTIAKWLWQQYLFVSSAAG